MNQLQAPCIACAKPASEHGEHHAVEKGDGSTGAIGMGGSKREHEHERVVLCRACHNDVHAGLLVLSRSRGFYALKRNGFVALRAIEEVPIADAESALTERKPAELRQILRRADDASLCLLWAATDRRAAEVVFVRALIAVEFRQRYGSFGDRWYARVAEIIRDSEGTSVSTGTIYNYAGIGIALEQMKGNPLDAIERLGVMLLAQAGKTIAAGGDAETTLELVADMRDEGIPVAQIVREIKEGNGKKSVPTCDASGVHVCKHCGIELEEQ